MRIVGVEAYKSQGTDDTHTNGSMPTRTMGTVRLIGVVSNNLRKENTVAISNRMARKHENARKSRKIFAFDRETRGTNRSDFERGGTPGGVVVIPTKDDRKLWQLAWLRESATIEISPPMDTCVRCAHHAPNANR